MATPKQPLVLQAFAWDRFDYRKEREDGSTAFLNAIFGFCHDASSNVVVLRVVKQPLVAYFQLPTEADGAFLKWDQGRLEAVVGRFLSRSTSTSSAGREYPTPKPQEVRLVWKKRIYGYRENELFPHLEAFFDTDSSLRAFSEALTKEPLEVNGHLLLVCRVEQGITHIRRFLTDANLRYTQWFRVTGYDEPTDKCAEGAEYVCIPGAIRPMDEAECAGLRTHPTVLSFDIETYASRENGMPKARSLLDEATMISCVFRRDGAPLATAERTCFVNGDAYPVPGAVIVACASELEMYRKFFAYIVRQDPTVVTGYNIFGYDFDYIKTRLDTFYRGEWPYLGRLPYLGRDQKRLFRIDEWESRSGGKHSNRYMAMDGRVLLDMIIEAKKSFNPKLPTYKLDEVARRKLGKTKRAVDHRESFRDRTRYIAALNDLIQLVGGNPFGSSADCAAACGGKRFRELMAPVNACYAAEVPKGIPDRISADELERLAPTTEAALWQAVTDEIARLTPVTEATLRRAHDITTEYHRAKLLLTKEAEYNLGDSDLNDELFDKLLVWVTAVQFSFVMGISPAELQLKGQQVRCISQVYDLAHREGFVVNAREKTPMLFKGGLVQSPKIGIWRNVLCFDFSGMYPSIMIAFNISPDTWVTPGNEADLSRTNDFHLTGLDFKLDDGEEDAKLRGKSKAFAEKERRSKKARGTKMSAALPGPDLRAEVRFVKSTVRAGLIPRVAQRLVNERNEVKVKWNKCAKGSFEWELFNQHQLAIKVVANSLYGFMGVREGRLPFVEGAACVTQKGREMISRVKEYLEANYGAEVIYGDTDSVMVVLPGVEGAAAMKQRGLALANEITAKLFGDYPAIKLEFEKGMDLMLTITKKKYAATMAGVPPTPDNLLIRGMLLVKKGFCPWIQAFYRELLFRILLGASAAEAIQVIFANVRRLFASRGPDLVVITEYGGPYAGTYFLGTFANKLQSRGEELSPGDQIDYIVTVHPLEDTPGADRNALKAAQKKGNKMELIANFEASQASACPMKIDYVWYLQKVAQKTIDQLFAIAYAGEEERLRKVSCRFGRCRTKYATEPVRLILEEIACMGRGVQRAELEDRLDQLQSTILARL